MELLDCFRKAKRASLIAHKSVSPQGQKSALRRNEIESAHIKIINIVRHSHK